MSKEQLTVGYGRVDITPDFPVALGVIRDVKDVTYDEGVRKQVEDVKAKSKIQCVDDLLRSGSTWIVE